MQKGKAILRKCASVYLCACVSPEGACWVDGTEAWERVQRGERVTWGYGQTWMHPHKQKRLSVPLTGSVTRVPWQHGRRQLYEGSSLGLTTPETELANNADMDSLNFWAVCQCLPQILGDDSADKTDVVFLAVDIRLHLENSNSVSWLQHWLAQWHILLLYNNHWFEIKFLFAIIYDREK